MSAADKKTIDFFGVDSLLLMERAALCVAQVVEERICGETAGDVPDIRAGRCAPKASQDGKNSGAVLFACGSGNNGGDGLCAARILFLKGYDVRIFFAGREESLSPDAKKHYDIAKRYGIPFESELKDGYAMYVDCIFGNGLARDIEGSYRDVIERLNGFSGIKLAVDIPSGVSADGLGICGIALSGHNGGDRVSEAWTCDISRRGVLRRT